MSWTCKCGISESIARFFCSNIETYSAAKNVLFSDSAVASHSAAISMGLVMVGSGNEQVTLEMTSYAHETQHDKIIKGLALGIACVWYGKESAADTVIASLLNDKDALMRVCAMHTLALAYSGTSANSAVSRLLAAAVGDASDDVRRAAVSALGFVLIGNTRIVRVVALLTESYNPHVRYGAACALGVACAATASIVSFF